MGLGKHESYANYAGLADFLGTRKFAEVIGMQGNRNANFGRFRRFWNLRLQTSVGAIYGSSRRYFTLRKTGGGRSETRAIVAEVKNGRRCGKLSKNAGVAHVENAAHRGSRPEL